MYLRPGNLCAMIEKKGASISSRGRARKEYDSEPGEQIRAVLAGSKTQEKERWRQLQHPINKYHSPKGKPAGGLEAPPDLGNRIFFIQE